MKPLVKLRRLLAGNVIREPEGGPPAEGGGGPGGRNRREVALISAIHLHWKHRNLTDAEIIRCIEALDRRKTWGGDRRSQEFKEEIKAPNGGLKKTAQATAKVVGVSPPKVERARTILQHASAESLT